MSLQEGDWLYNKIANRHVQTYVKGFLDVSGGDVILRNGNLNVGGRSDLSGDTVMHQNANVRGLIKQSDTVIEGGFIYKEITSSEVQDTLDDLNELKTTIDSIITTEVDNGVDVINIGTVNNKIVIGDNNTFAQGNQGLITENQSNFNLIDIGSKTSLPNISETNAGTSTLVGKDALNDMNFNVFHNTAFGFNSGNGIIDGTMNTFLGSGSGASSDISNSTAIGYNSIVTSSNKFLLGPNTGTLQDVIIPGNVEALNNVLIVGDASINNMFVSGDASMNNMFVVGDGSMNSNLFVGGDTSMNNNLFVDGHATINNNLSVSGDLSIVGDVSMNNNVDIGTIIQF